MKKKNGEDLEAFCDNPALSVLIDLVFQLLDVCLPTFAFSP